MTVRRLCATALSALLLLAGAACGDDDTAPTSGSVPDQSSDTTAAETPEETTTTAPEPLTVLVTNDDGIGAPGIDALLEALGEVDGLELVLVAPAENQSGSSDKTTEGEVAFADATSAGGFEGTAVSGFPADSVNVALDELEIEPDLVVSGVNEGQNVGPLASLSGTVGAARTAARRGIPAVAASAGLAETADYETAAQLVVDWIEEQRDAIADASLPTDSIVSFNVPGCTAGEIGDLVEVPLASAIPEGLNVFATDCSVPCPAPPVDDVDAMRCGIPAETVVPTDL